MERITFQPKGISDGEYAYDVLDNNKPIFELFILPTPTGKLSRFRHTLPFQPVSNICKLLKENGFAQYNLETSDDFSSWIIWLPDIDESLRFFALTKPQNKVN